jgi:hypothetical protein
MLITSLDTIQLKAISVPATEMLSSIINAIPNILVALLIIAIFYVIGRYLKGIVTELLKNIDS